MLEPLDLRGVRKQAKVLLKSTSCTDRMVAQSLGTTFLKSSSSQSTYTPNNSFQSLNQSQSNFLQSSLYGGDSSLVSRPSTSKYKEKEFRQRCWEAFTKYSRIPGDIPFDQCELGLPSECIAAAVSEVVGRAPPNDSSKRSVLLSSNITLSWTDFKKYASEVVSHLPTHQLAEESGTNPPSGSRTGSPTTFDNAYKHLIQRQRSASHIVFDDIEDRNIADDGHHNVLKNSKKLLPISVVKDAAAKLLRRESLNNLKPKLPRNTKGNFLSNEPSDSVVTTKPSFSDSTSSLLGTTQLHSSHPDLSFPHQRPFESPVQIGAGFTKMTEKQRMAGLFNQGEEYPSKWLAMKQKRDERRAREEARQMRIKLQHSVQRIAMKMEKEEYNSTVDHLSHTREAQVMTNKMMQDEKNYIMKHNIKTRKEMDVARKRKEALYLRDTIDDSTSAMKSMLHEEMNTIRKRNYQNNNFELDSSTSSIVEIPEELKHNLKNARSLLQFNAAKKAIKDFNENTLSSRIARIAHSRKLALHIAKADSPTIRKTPFEGNSLFTDSISLGTNDFGDTMGSQGSSASPRSRGGLCQKSMVEDDSCSWISDVKRSTQFKIKKKRPKSDRDRPFRAKYM